MPTQPPKPPPEKSARKTIRQRSDQSARRFPDKPTEHAAEEGSRTPVRAVRQRHDETYRKLFGDRHMMMGFIRGFLPPRLLAGWDLETLERKDTQWVNGRLERRAGDVVWRLRRRNPAAGAVPAATETAMATSASTSTATAASSSVSARDADVGVEDDVVTGLEQTATKRLPEWFYLYILFEQQGRPDHRMPLRGLEYVVLFLNALLDAREIPVTGPYPLVLPIVLYNGKRRWRAGTSLRHYQPPIPEALRPFNPAFEFLLIDINTLDPQRLQELASACAVFFQMEREDNLQGLVDLIPRLDALLPEDSHSALRRTLATWIHEVAILARGGKLDETLLQTQSLSEVHTMLAERVKDWFADARREGRQEGRQDGLLEGQAKGELKGAALILQTQLQQKFGPLPDWALARIAQADTETLRQWALNVLRAEHLEAVFGD